MIITILGSGPANAIPRGDCRCALCRDARQGGKSARRRSSILIQDKKTSVLVDTSPDFLLQAWRENIRKVDAVFFTHEHSDATGGFNDFLWWCKRHGSTPKIYAPPAVGDYLRRKFTAAEETNISHLAPGQLIKIGDLTIESFEVRHGMGKAIPTVGYRLNKKTIFISDFDDLPPQSAKYLRGAKIMILDAAMWFGRKMKGHNTPREAIAIAKKFNPKILYLTQTGHTWPPHDLAQREILKYAKERRVPFPVILTYDGLQIKT